VTSSTPVVTLLLISSLSPCHLLWI